MCRADSHDVRIGIILRLDSKAFLPKRSIQSPTSARREKSFFWGAGCETRDSIFQEVNFDLKSAVSLSLSLARSLLKHFGAVSCSGWHIETRHDYGEH